MFALDSVPIALHACASLRLPRHRCVIPPSQITGRAVYFNLTGPAATAHQMSRITGGGNEIKCKRTPLQSRSSFFSKGDGGGVEERIRRSESLAANCGYRRRRRRIWPTFARPGRSSSVAHNSSRRCERSDDGVACSAERGVYKRARARCFGESRTRASRTKSGRRQTKGTGLACFCFVRGQYPLGSSA